MSTQDVMSPVVNANSMDRRQLMIAAVGGVAMSVVASLAGGVSAQTPATPSSASLEDLLAATLETGVPGVALAVERKGDLVFSGAAGLASLENSTPLKPNDRFRIYSITKTFTATLVFQLIDEGILTLEDTVAMWLEDPAVALIPNVAEITIGQVLTHTSGIYDFGDDNDSSFWDDAFLGPTADWAKVWTLPELLAYASEANHAPYFAPGEGQYYSNTNYLLLGMIIEKATGSAFGDELQRRILTPLGLKDTALATGASLPEGLVDGYQLLDDDLVNVSEINLSWAWTAGGMTSTAADLLRFASATFSGELLSPESFDAMFTLVPSGQPGLEFGSGLYQQETPNGTFVGMDGGSAGFIAIMMRLPEEEVTVIVLINQAPDNGASEKLRDEAFAWTIAN